MREEAPVLHFGVVVIVRISVSGGDEHRISLVIRFDPVSNVVDSAFFFLETLGLSNVQEVVLIKDSAFFPRDHAGFCSCSLAPWG